MNTRITLVLGATGGIGGELASRLASGGWQVRALNRNPDRAGKEDRFQWIKGDAMVAADVATAAEGASLIVHAVNPPGYSDWDKLVLPMLDNTIAAAEANGARIVLPGTVYNYGPDAFPVIAEDAPQNPLTRKGKIRREMERRLKAAAGRGKARVLIVRAGDFFGPRAANNWFSQGLVKAGSRPRSIGYPGKRGIGHQWAYLPDVAETMARLVEHDGLADFESFHMDGHWDADGTKMTEAIRHALDDPFLPVKSMPWWLMRLASPFVPFLREVMEMRYLWQVPVRLDNARLVATLGAEPRTPLDKAIRATLIGVGCLGSEAPERAVSQARLSRS
ncbi:SDR family oxidoreductase [Pleomorphomonas sp. NRK KF1]|uniref:SDR family oxidoreductase n=1 Tax=Pleomorphomonas sp. NRK KF1 TaxID=2943000 RepID=UPI00204420B2|nr:SDR family oxidoreductase [Pleomorphomonas sp. NRK KF1]MCM5555195.1 SDR family oxidoreductase [Pleomorphomonas sp. NRK KF1]